MFEIGKNRDMERRRVVVIICTHNDIHFVRIVRYYYVGRKRSR